MAGAENQWGIMREAGLVSEDVQLMVPLTEQGQAKGTLLHSFAGL